MPQVDGTVSVLESGWRVAGLRVIVHEEGQSIILAQVETDSDGRFSAVLQPNCKLQERHYKVAFLGPGGTQPQDAIESATITPESNDLAQVVVQLPAAKLNARGIETNLAWHVETIEFSGGSKVPIAENSLTIIVGPNSSGKTRSLLEIAGSCLGPQPAYKVIRQVSTSARPAPWLLKNWLRSKYPRRTVNGQEVVEFYNSQLAIENATLESSRSHLVFSLGIEERLHVSHYQQFGQIESAPANLIDYAVRSDEILRRLSAETREAFSVDLIAEIGPQIGFRVGEASQLPGGMDRASGDYRRALLPLEKLDAAGDGIRSFVGTLIAISACPHRIVLVDEPEAFLHPPQARMLGKKLAEATRERQVVVATHSAEIVLGALSVGGAKVQLLRLSRSRDKNHATFLNPEGLTQITSDPQWESTELLECMFHRGAILCEADSDRRFYRWLESESDINYVACGGKGGIAKAAKALSLIGIPTAAVVDFDLLSNEAELRNILDALGTNPDEILSPASRYSEIRPALGIGREKTQGEISSELETILAENRAGTVDRTGLVKKVASVINSTKAGFEAKRYGVDKLRGELHEACGTLLQRMAAVGLFVVPCGELEGWWRAGPADKGEWIVAAWQKMRTQPGVFNEAQAFVGRARSYLDARNA